MIVLWWIVPRMVMMRMIIVCVILVRDRTL